MGTFFVDFEVGNLNGGEPVGVRALVDTGASYTVLGRDLLERLGVEPMERREFGLADGSFVAHDMGYAWLSLEGRRAATPVVFGTPGAGSLLGAVTLQELGLIADSVNERLIPMPPIRARFV